MTVIDAFSHAEVVTAGGFALRYRLAPFAVVAQNLLVAAHHVPYSGRDSVLHGERIGNEFLRIEGECQQHSLLVGKIQFCGGIHKKSVCIVERLVLSEDCHILVADTIVSVFGRLNANFIGYFRSLVKSDFFNDGSAFERQALVVHLDKMIVDCFCQPCLVFLAVCRPVHHAVADCTFGQHGKPCTTYISRHCEEIVQIQEIEFAVCVGDHCVDNHAAHIPESLDYGDLFLVLLTLVVADEIVIIAHGELEVVRIDKSAVH